MIKLKVLSTLAFFTVLVGCTSDNFDDYYADKCDTSNVTYSQTVEPILKNRCVGCHSTAFANGNVLLDSYAEVKKHVDNGSLLGSIKHEAGFEPMPLGGKLDDCSINKIEAWINAGAFNN